MNIAVLLDLDNIKPRLSTIETICQSYGQVVARRAFSNTPAVLAAYGGEFRKFEYRFELTPGLNPIPQEVDNLIGRTAFEIIEIVESNIKMIAVVSNDNDYARLFNRLKYKGIKTLVIGNQIGNQLRENADYVEVLKEVMRPTYVGIDLGTTNTVMALANINLMTQQWTANAIEVPVKSEQGSLVKNQIIPSSVRFNSTTEAEVGGHIKSQAYAFRDQTILAWKHHMGYSNNGKAFYYELTSGRITPEEAAAKVLAFCRNKLVQMYGEVQGAVITHPASYESDAIEATRKAAVLAGWREEEVVLLPEPQAALYDFLYRVQKGEIPPPFDISQPSNILVYDLGGGTLDVTLHNVEWSQSVKKFIIQDIAIGSRTRVGGDTVDEFISEYILRNSANSHTLSEAEQKKLKYELPIYAEKFKKLWGAEYTDFPDKQSFQYPFQGNFLDSQVPLRYYVSAQKMREILAPLLCNDISLADVAAMNSTTAFNETPFIDRFNTFIVPVQEVLLKAKQTTGKIPQIDAVLLNGGMTYFPPVRERLATLFGNTPIIDDGNPDLAVARGAALFASGALKSSERVNPTHIYLEVYEDGESKLRMLVRQGQKYPYKTILKGFKLPNINSGYLVFNVWVGMGSQLNQNTTLQRLRQVAVDKIFAANLQPGCLLDMEVEYTFDERLLLTLISTETNEARFHLEVANDSRSNHHQPVEHTSPSVTALSITIPAIARTRTTKPIASGTKINFHQWEGIATSLNQNWSHGAQQQFRRELERKTATAENRLSIISDLVKWLEMSNLMTSSLAETRALLAVMALSTIFQSIDSADPKYSGTEKRFEQWLKKKLSSGLSRFSNEFFVNIAETPGKLFWSNFDDDLIRAFKSYQGQAQALAFLNSLGKCGRPAKNTLDLLHNVIKKSQHLGQREKAAWALGRLISLGQPEEWQASFVDVEKAAKLALEQLLLHETRPQVAQSILGYLSQCVAWHAKGMPLSQEICEQVRKLPQTNLAVDQYLSGYPQIQDAFEQRLPLLPKMLEIERASSDDIDQMQAWLLESLKG